MTDITARNRAIKKTLELAFGRGKVRVRGERGTAYGWANVQIAYAPLDWQQGRELHSQVIALLRAAKIDLGGWYDDMSNEKRPEISTNFERCRYRETRTDPTGHRWGLREGERVWERIEAERVA